MKKKLVTLICLFICLIGQAQNDTIMTVAQIYEHRTTMICANKYDRAIIYAPEGCNDFGWFINNQYLGNENPIILDGNLMNQYYGEFGGCGFTSFQFLVKFLQPNVPTETTEEMWKHQYETITLEAVGADSIDMYTYFWPHNGATTPTVEVTSQGNYECLISDLCATATRTKVVKENVEIDLATCDLESNLNLVTWQTTSAQAEYIDHVIVKRDGMQVGIASYSDGYYLDAIGSSAASRTYTLVAVATDGMECPIVSYPKETIHMSYTLGVNGTIEVGRNTPTGYDLVGYNICEWIPNGKDGELRVIDYVGASVTSYTCQASQFTNGYVVIQGVEAGKPESRLLSNHSAETVGIGEYGMDGFKVYPNPASGVFTVEGGGHLSVMNLLSQEILTQEVEGKTTLELPKGIYFVKLGSTTKKVVVE